MSIIIQRPYDHLISELQGIFKDQQDVEVRIDNRSEERRRENQPFSHERRQTDRRREKDTLLEVIITA